MGGDKITQRFGVTGMRIVQRIMGLILMVIAVQFIINGVTAVIRYIK
jgi:multiple antibiotic resistance protein